MRRRTFLAATAGFSACDRRPSLNVFNWYDYIAPDTLPGFEREFGVRIRYGTYEGAEEMLARVMTGNSGWDIAFPPNSFVQPMREMGLLARIDPSGLKNLAALDEPFRSPIWDPQLEWSLPYMWGATGIVYQRSLHPAPQSWADLWSERLRGRVTMLDDPTEVFGACLKKLGYSANSTTPDELQRAKGEAVAQKRVLRAYLNAEARDQLVAGDILAAQAWRITAMQAISAAPDRLAFVYPREGFPVYTDCAAILKELRRVELAHTFLDYLLRPAVAAAIADAMRTATCNGPARKLMTTPQEDAPPGGEWQMPLTAPAQRLRDRLWTEIKSA